VWFKVELTPAFFWKNVSGDFIRTVHDKKNKTAHHPKPPLWLCVFKKSQTIHVHKWVIIKMLCLFQPHHMHGVPSSCWTSKPLWENDVKQSTSKFWIFVFLTVSFCETFSVIFLFCGLQKLGRGPLPGLKVSTSISVKDHVSRTKLWSFVILIFLFWGFFSRSLLNPQKPPIVVHL